MLLVVLLLSLAAVGAFLPKHTVSRVSLPAAGLEQPSLSHTYPQTATGYGMKLTHRYKQPLKDLLGFGPAEIAVALVVALVLFGPETLKSLSKDVGRAAAELKEIPKTFKEGMDEGAESSQVSKMKAIAAEKRKKRDAKVAAAEDETAEEKDDDDA
jgi:Sec-independent protein translocase protein TatA